MLNILHVNKDLNNKIEELKKSINSLDEREKFNSEILVNIARDINLVKNGQWYSFDDDVIVTRIFTGQKMFVNRKDLSLAPHLILDGEWEMEFTKLFRSLVKSDSVIIDIGANQGWFGLVGSTENSTGITVAIEANPDLTTLIEKSFLINGISGRCKVLNMALSDKEGELTLARCKDLWGSSRIYSDIKGDILYDKLVKVRSTSLDLIVEELKLEKVDIIKMDIEGYEEIAWNGMQNTIRKNKDNLVFCMEYSPSCYNDPIKFFSDMQDKFSYINFVDFSGKLCKVENIVDLDNTISLNGFVMLVMSNLKFY